MYTKSSKTDETDMLDFLKTRGAIAPPIHFDTQFNGVAQDEYLNEKYDAQQIQNRIEDADAIALTGIGICQGTVLAGFQITSTQLLYGMGCIGLFPAIVAGLPVGIAFSATLSQITIDNGLSISDLSKFCSGLGRCAILTLSSWKLHHDAQKADAIALRGVSTIQADLDKFEGRPAPQVGDGNLLWVVGAIVVLGWLCRGKR